MIQKLRCTTIFIKRYIILFVHIFNVIGFDLMCLLNIFQIAHFFILMNGSFLSCYITLEMLNASIMANGNIQVSDDKEQITNENAV